VDKRVGSRMEWMVWRMGVFDDLPSSHFFGHGMELSFKVLLDLVRKLSKEGGTLRS
jgi:hypothetical protein